MPNRNLALAATALEVGILVAGLVLLWRLVLSPAARQRPVVDRLPRWQITLRDFLFFVWLVFGGVAVASACSAWFLKRHSFEGDVKVAIATAVSQLGMLTGIAAFKRFYDRRAQEPTPPGGSGFLKAGVTTFLIAMPVVALVGVLWQSLLQLVGMPEEKQDLIRMFLEAKSPLFVAVMVLLACVGAPLTEELIFRGGFFRYCRTRMPRWMALLLPACLFAAMHANLSIFAPLVVLGIIFSLAYERTGSIGTSIVAHALFNLNSIIVIFSNVQF